MGDFIEKFPEYINELKRWTKSDNRWIRRAAAVSLIVPAKHGKFLKEAIEIADLLLTDDDDHGPERIRVALKRGQPQSSKRSL